MIDLSEDEIEQKLKYHLSHLTAYSKDENLRAVATAIIKGTAEAIHANNDEIERKIDAIVEQRIGNTRRRNQ